MVSCSRFEMCVGVGVKFHKPDKSKLLKVRVNWNGKFKIVDGSGEPRKNKLFQLKPYDNFLICPLMLSTVRF